MKVPPPVADLIGIERRSFGDGKCTMEMEVEERHSNPMGTVHGGILCDLADAAMGMAYFLTLADGDDEKHAAATLHIRRHLLRDHDPENDPAYPALLDRVLADDV